jgi:hypothetical protein
MARRKGTKKILIAHPETGAEYSLRELVAYTGLTYEILYGRYKMKWTPAEIFGLVKRQRPGKHQADPKKIKKREANWQDYDPGYKMRLRAQKVAKAMGYDVEVD